MNNKIYVTAFPKSGVTWLIHLLSDLLNSPQDGVEWDTPMVHGLKGDGGYKIIKRHCEFKDKDDDEAQWVHLLRDPRDVATSKHFYNGRHFNKPLDGSINVIIRDYKKWVSPWLVEGAADVNTTYESLRLDGVSELQRVAKLLTNKDYSTNQIKATFERQRIENTRKKTGKNHARKGIIGDWKNHFTQDNANLIYANLGEFLIENGYEKDNN